MKHRSMDSECLDALEEVKNVEMPKNAAEKLNQVISLFQSKKNNDILVQVWMLDSKTSKLSTTNCNFACGYSKELVKFRKCSENYLFGIESEDKQGEGLPGRAFVSGRPEMTASVQQYTEKAYFRLLDAIQYGVQASAAFPVFERRRGTMKTVAVFELIKLTKDSSFGSLADEIACLTEKFNLITWGRADPSTRVCLMQKSLRTESLLQHIFEKICYKFYIPFAQFWCAEPTLADAGNDEDGTVHLSCKGLACCVNDSAFLNYKGLCKNLKIKSGYGLIGTAWEKECSIWNSDVHKKVKNPEMCQWQNALPREHSRGVVAIPITLSKESGRRFILEVFLDPECVGEEKQRELIIETMVALLKTGQGFFNLGVRVDHYELSDLAVDEAPPPMQTEQSISRASVASAKCYGPRKPIPLEVLQQYFKYNLKEAAKKLDICPTTLKRICRHYGIPRWPCRKLKKVNRSISKLQCFVESVPGLPASAMGIDIKQNANAFDSADLFFNEGNQHSDDTILPSPKDWPLNAEEDIVRPLPQLPPMSSSWQMASMPAESLPRHGYSNAQEQVTSVLTLKGAETWQFAPSYPQTGHSSSNSTYYQWYPAEEYQSSSHLNMPMTSTMW